MKLSKRLAIGSLTVCLNSLWLVSGHAWEASYPNGPVRILPGSPGQDVNIKIRNARPFQSRLGVLGQQPSLADVFTRRTVAYPSGEGAGLGYGWDFLLNRKRFSTCVDFTPQDDTKYQNADVRLQEVTDDETLDITLNTEFSGSVGGTIDVVDAKAQATSTLNASHHMASTDVVFVAHASVTSGVTYAGPKKNDSFPAVSLLPAMALLAQTDPEGFREKCGDGFVGSIGLGADLYLLLHFHTLTTEDRLQLSFDSNASAGFGDVFNASGSSKLSTTIDRLSKQGSLDINLVQQGGIIKSLPIDLKTAREKVQNLTTEESSGPRAIFVTIVPYSELPNWPGLYLLDASDIRQRAIRYAQRLASIYFELMNIRDDYYRDRQANGATGMDRYLYSYRHQLRNEDLLVVSKNLQDRITEVNDVIRELNGPECNTSPVAANPVLSGSRVERVSQQQRYEVLFDRLKRQKQSCADAINQLVADTENLDDFKIWIKLPIPINTISDDALATLDDPSKPLQDRKLIYAQRLFGHWVEREDQIRCRLFFECLSSDAKKDLYNDIMSSLIVGSGTTVRSENYTMCIGEFDWGCRGGQIRFDCDHADDNADARSVCQVSRRAFRYSWKRVQTHDGNRCGYGVDQVTCYFAQPLYP